MQHKIKRLIQHCNTKLQHNQNVLISHERELRISKEMVDELTNRILTLKQLCMSLCKSGEFSRSELLSLQRRRATLLRKIAETEIMLSQKKSESEMCEVRKGETLAARKNLLNKMDKYEHLHDIERKKLRLFRQEAEEKEIEERISWQR
ncbi:hypothetical protein [unidentified bacterial endosymbiont]|uniref:hypothetical protein n=1 Tax=unidentified bacterial endosymbiont TaxID=2355 RepID=UPI0020A11553|nr:hypothetical protein [unidentified bacterial endosymbiont]